MIIAAAHSVIVVSRYRGARRSTTSTEIFSPSLDEWMVWHGWRVWLARRKSANKRHSDSSYDQAKHTCGLALRTAVNRVYLKRME